MMRGVSETEINFNSVERIVEYCNLESEPYECANPGMQITQNITKMAYWRSSSKKNDNFIE